MIRSLNQTLHPQLVDLWDGDLIVSAFNRFAISTLIHRTTRFTTLVHLDGRSRARRPVIAAATHVLGVRAISSTVGATRQQDHQRPPTHFFPKGTLLRTYQPADLATSERTRKRRPRTTRLA